MIGSGESPAAWLCRSSSRTRAALWAVWSGVGINTTIPPEGKGLAMTIVQRMRAQLREAMKARDAVRTNFLRYWIAQLTLGTGEEVADDQAVKKMRGILKEAQAGQTAFSPEEQALLREWVPSALSR